jgi:hypothetical protein
MPEQTISRRKLLTRAGQSVAMIPLVTLSAQTVWAAEKITEDHPMATALGYVHDAAKTDTAKFPKRAGAEGAEQFCYNCSQYKETEPEWGTCNIFPSLLVAKDGWCNVWVPMS